MNSVINCETTTSTWEDQILYHEVPSDVKESMDLDLKLCYNTFEFKEGENLTQPFTRYKALMNELDFQDSTNDEEDTRSSQEYLNDLEEEFHERTLLANSKRFFKKGSQRFSGAKETDETQATNVGGKKPELRPTKDFEARYNKVNAKLALLSSSASTSKSSIIKNKGLIIEAYEWDDEDVSSGDNEMVKVKVLMALIDDDNVVVADDTKVSIPRVERPWLSEVEGFNLPNHDTGRILLAESQLKVTDSLVIVTDSSVPDYDSADESSVCSTPLPSLKKLAGAESVSGPKTIKSILKSNSTFKAETLKGVTINEPTSALTNGNKNVLVSKKNSTPTGKLKNVKIEEDIPLSVCDIRKPIWYLDSGCSRHMTGVKSYLHKYVEQPGPKVLDEKKGVIFNSNKEVVMIAPKDLSFQNSTVLKLLPLHATLKTVFFHNYKDHLGKFDEKADDGYFLRYSLVSKAFKVFNTRREQTKETYHITFDESTEATKFSKPLVDDINIAKSKRYPTNEYLHPFEPSQRIPLALNAVSSIQTEFPSSIPSMASLAPQDRWSRDKHIELVHIVGNLGTRMLTRTKAKELSVASAHECLFVYFLFEEEPKKVSKALKHPGWVHIMQEELNQFPRNKVWRWYFIDQ
ncbi:hypothetical protein Tco_0924406 [Tanacetum coccineum]|uniref:Retroviral polymerase SH3-like domain-containing protein n=1 Tax=Tanacetum coccineum TaxID=301880 RepID=A0ABQ5D4R8_9ASTR